MINSVSPNVHKNHMKKIFLTYILTASAAFSITAHSEGQAGDLRDDSTVECVNAYYGIGQPVDYAKAYKCFDSHKIYEYIIPMQLNGEGVPVSIDQAKKLMNEWLVADPDNAGSLDETNMRKILDERSANPLESDKKVDFCHDIAGTNYSMGFCFWVQDQLDKQKLENSIEPIQSKLHGDELVMWRTILNAFNSYLNAEGKRGMQLYAGGSAAGSAYTLQQTFVRQHFYGAMQAIFGGMKLIPSSKSDLTKTEADLQAAYNASIADFEDSYAPSASTNSETSDDREFIETETNYIAQYKADVATSQKKWLALRDACAKLAVVVYRDKPNVDWGVSAKRALAVLRIGDLKNRPLGDD